MELEIKIAKANEKDIRSTEDLLDFLEQIFYNDDIEDCQIFKDIARELGYCSSLITMEEASVVLLEAIRRKFDKCSGRWMKVISTVDVMVDQLCDKNVSYINLDPHIKRALDNSMLGE